MVACLSRMPTSFSKHTDSLASISTKLDSSARLTGVSYGRMPHNYSLKSISPVLYKVKTVCSNGGVNGCKTGEMVPARNSLQGVRVHPNGYVDLLIATLMHISAFQNRNSQTTSGYFPVTRIHH